MSTQTYWESVKLNGAHLLDTFKKLIHEGNVRRVVIKQDDRTIAEFPLTIGVVGAALAPPLAAVGAIAALVTGARSKSNGRPSGQSSRKIEASGRPSESVGADADRHRIPLLAIKAQLSRR